MSAYQFEHDGYLLSTYKSLLQLDVIHTFLANESYWAKDIPKSIVAKSISNSLCFGVYANGVQVAFARVISDFSTIAYLGDVYVLDEYRGQGLSKKLIDCIMTHPNLQGLRRWILLTSTADWLYEKYGFIKVPKPEIYMELFDPEVYAKKEA